MTKEADELGQALDELEKATEQAMGEASTQPELDDLRAAVLGKDGTMTGLLKQLGRVTADERKVLGGQFNGFRYRVEVWYQERAAVLRGEHG